MQLLNVHIKIPFLSRTECAVRTGVRLLSRVLSKMNVQPRPIMSDVIAKRTPKTVSRRSLVGRSCNIQERIWRWTKSVLNFDRSLPSRHLIFNRLTIFSNLLEKTKGQLLINNVSNDYSHTQKNKKQKLHTNNT